jgi:hypothetical protein
MVEPGMRHTSVCPPPKLPVMAASAQFFHGSKSTIQPVPSHSKSERSVVHQAIIPTLGTAWALRSAIEANWWTTRSRIRFPHCEEEI